MKASSSSPSLPPSLPPSLSFSFPPFVLSSLAICASTHSPPPSPLPPLPSIHFRCNYLSVLKQLLLNSQWFARGDRYRREDICAALESMHETGKEDETGEANAEALELIDDLFEECYAILVE